MRMLSETPLMSCSREMLRSCGGGCCEDDSSAYCIWRHDGVIDHAKLFLFCFEFCVFVATGASVVDTPWLMKMMCVGYIYIYHYHVSPPRFTLYQASMGCPYDTAAATTTAIECRFCCRLSHYRRCLHAIGC